MFSKIHQGYMTPFMPDQLSFTSGIGENYGVLFIY